MIEGPVMITGGTGFLGGQLAKRLSGGGVHVRTLARNLARAEQIARFPVELVPGDVLSTEDVLRCAKNCKVIFHCAYGNAGSPEAQARVTIQGTQNVLEAARTLGCRVVHVSSVAVYGTEVRGSFHEELPNAPGTDCYALTKSQAEDRVLDAFRSHQTPVAIVQPTIIYGPFSPFWTLWLARTLRQGPVALTPDSGTCNLIFVEDVVDALIAAAVQPAVLGRRVLVSGESTDWPNFLAGYSSLFGNQGHVLMSESEILQHGHTAKESLASYLFWLRQHEPQLWVRLLSTRELHFLRSIVLRVMPSSWMSRFRQRNNPIAKVAPKRGGPEKPKPFYPDANLLRQTRIQARAETKLARELLGWQPRHGLAQGMELTRRWLRWFCQTEGA